MKTIIVKSPTRVDLAGGTLDLWPLYNFVERAVTINLSIDIWTTCEISTTEDNTFVIESVDLNKVWNFENWNSFKTSTDEKLLFFKTILNPFSKDIEKKNCGFKIKTGSQSPIGGGLGGSSSLVISILKALFQWLEIEIPSRLDLVHLAHNIEARMLRTPTGTQDYFGAVNGGLSFIEYGPKGIINNSMSVSGTPIADHFLLVYTGKSHHSGLNNFEVLKSSVQGDSKVLAALKEIKDVADDMKEAVEGQHWAEIPSLFKREYAARIQLTPAFTSPEIEKLNEICLEAGAEAVKICGAGGGGCVLVWVSPTYRPKVIEACKGKGFECLNTKPIDLLK